MKSHSLISDVHTDSDVLLKLDVNIDDDNQIEKLEILNGQNPVEVVDNFCERFNIVDIKKERLHKIVAERLNISHTQHEQDITSNPQEEEQDHEQHHEQEQDHEQEYEKQVQDQEEVQHQDQEIDNENVQDHHDENPENNNEHQES